MTTEPTPLAAVIADGFRHAVLVRQAAAHIVRDAIDNKTVEVDKHKDNLIAAGDFLQTALSAAAEQVGEITAKLAESDKIIAKLMGHVAFSSQCDNCVRCATRAAQLLEEITSPPPTAPPGGSASELRQDALEGVKQFVKDCARLAGEGE